MLPFEGMITVADAAKRLNRSIEQVRRYLREGKLKGQRIGNQWFVDEKSLGVRYQTSGQRPQSIREPTAVMETSRMTTEKIKGIIRRIDANREAIYKRIGGNVDIDVVEMLRRDREER